MWKCAKNKKGKENKVYFSVFSNINIVIIQNWPRCSFSFHSTFWRGKRGEKEREFVKQMHSALLSPGKDCADNLEKCANAVTATQTKATLISSAWPSIRKLQIITSFNKAGSLDSNPRSSWFIKTSTFSVLLFYTFLLINMGHRCFLVLCLVPPLQSAQGRFGVLAYQPGGSLTSEGGKWGENMEGNPKLQIFFCH